MENNHSFFARLTANVFLNDSDFYFLCDAFKTHYDFKINESIEVGGFLYGFKTRRTPINGLTITDEDRVCQFESKHFQLILKSLEMQYSPQANEINKRMLQIVDELIEKQKSINNNLISN